MQESIMQQGVDLMLFGMGTVFVFLTILVIATTIMSSLISRYLPEPELLPVRQSRPKSAPEASVNDPHLLAVIKAAVDQHRAKKP